MNIKKILLSFLLLTIIAGVSTYLIISTMKRLSVNTEKMYTYPFTVTNALSDIQTGIITIHKNMKDVVLTKDSIELIKIIENIQHEEDIILKKFDTVYSSYLGHRKDIDKPYKAFRDWKELRENEIALVYNQKVAEAIKITKGEAAKHVQTLHDEINTLKKRAFQRANDFYNNSVKNNGLNFVLTSIILAIIFSSLIIIYIIIKLQNINKTTNKQLYLIDQNILTAKLTLDREVLDISSALCRTLNKKKNELLNKKCEYFFATKEQFELFDTKIYSGKEHADEIYIIIEDVKYWFQIEIFPELDNNFEIKYFNIFLTNISDKKKIEEIAIVDTLTGLNNRNYFESIFEKEIKRAKRDKKALSVLSFDIDFFKQYNDTYGHQEGDKTLKTVANVLKSHTNRSYDHSFRVGGEEFIILAYHENLKKLNEYASEIIDEVENLKIPHKSSKISDYVTISCGVGYFETSHLLSADDVYKKVDELLYIAKQEGRNRYKISEFK